MFTLIPTLRKLSRTDLTDLLLVITGKSLISEEASAQKLSSRLISELYRLCGLPEGDEPLLERHMMSRLANDLRIDYDPSMETAAIATLLEQYISDSIVEDLRPFIQVAVCIGWADGMLAPEEIAVMDAALSRLRLLSRRRSELLNICTRKIEPEAIKDMLTVVGQDDQKAWSMLTLGWAVALSDMRTHPKEIEVFQQIAAYLGVGLERADALRELVTRRFKDSLDANAHAGSDGHAPRALAKATMAAITAAELDSYLQAATGLKSLSLLLSSPVRLSDHGDSRTALDAMLRSDSWVGVPAALAGALFLRRLGGDELSQQLLAVVLTCLERTR
ncbi:MAG: hypothetical protein ABI333_11345 [bacterium]